jgi:hypothetical protein
MVEVTDAELESAKARWAEERAGRPVPVAVRFDRETGRIIVDFDNGATFLVPARALEGLEHATADQLSEVELLGETGLHWEALDVDYTIQGLMAGIFGSRAFLEAQRRGGQSRSPAKVAASRVNGARGGRPKKSAG